MTTDSGDDAKILEELGDLLLQVAMHAEIAASESRFDAAKVSEAVASKMVARHPHVFGSTKRRDRRRRRCATGSNVVKVDELERPGRHDVALVVDWRTRHAGFFGIGVDSGSAETRGAGRVRFRLARRHGRSRCRGGAGAVRCGRCAPDV